MPALNHAITLDNAKQIFRTSRSTNSGKEGVAALKGHRRASRNTMLSPNDIRRAAAL